MLRQISQQPDQSKRAIQLAQDYVLRLEHLEDDGADAVIGEFTRCQGTNLPAEIDGPTRKALTAKNLGHSIVFRYNHKLAVLGVQYDTKVISPGRILDYLSAFNASAQYSMEPRINKDAWKKFNSGQTRKLVMRIANPTDLKDVEVQGNAAGQSIKAMAEAYDAPSITIEISMGRRKGGLSKAIRGLADTFSKLGNPEVHVEKLSAVTVVDDASEPIDLIEDRVTIKDTISIDDRDPDKNYQVKKNYLSIEMKKLVG